MLEIHAVPYGAYQSAPAVHLLKSSCSGILLLCREVYGGKHCTQ
jgi:hypothetical protein